MGPPGHMRQQHVPFNHDLAGILNVIPPSYDDVSVHYNFPNKRHRREAEEEEDDADWYDDVYMPWYESQEHMMEALQNLPQMKVDHDEALSHLENYSMVMQQLQEYMHSMKGNI